MTINLSHILKHSPFIDNLILLQEEPTAIDRTGTRPSPVINQIPLKGSLQPNQGKHSMQVPEGLQQSSTYIVFVTNANNPQGGRTGKYIANRDKIYYQNQYYQVIDSEDWTIHAHTKLLVTLIDNQDSNPPINNGNNAKVEPLAGHWDELGRNWIKD